MSTKHGIPQYHSVKVSSAWVGLATTTSQFLTHLQTYEFNLIPTIISSFFLQFTSEILNFIFFWKARCPDPGLLYQGSRIDEDFRHNHTVRFACPRDYIMEGVSAIKCTDGRWSNNKPNCKGKCIQFSISFCDNCILYLKSKVDMFLFNKLVHIIEYF